MTCDLSRRGRLAAVLVSVSLLALGGCGLDEVKVPALVGPADLGLSLDLKANPDIVNADGVSTSLVVITARDQNGDPAVQRTLFVQPLCPGAGACADGFLTPGTGFVGPVQTGFAVVTNSDGQATVVYTAGTLPDSQVVVAASPYSFDSNQNIQQVVFITQR